MTTQQDNSKVRRRLEKSISDDNLVRLIETWFRTQTVGLLRPRDYVVKGWLDIDQNDDIKVVFIVDGPAPPTKKKENLKKKGGVRVSCIYGTQLSERSAV